MTRASTRKVLTLGILGTMLCTTASAGPAEGAAELVMRSLEASKIWLAGTVGCGAEVLAEEIPIGTRADLGSGLFSSWPGFDPTQPKFLPYATVERGGRRFPSGFERKFSNLAHQVIQDFVAQGIPQGNSQLPAVKGDPYHQFIEDSAQAVVNIPAQVKHGSRSPGACGEWSKRVAARLNEILKANQVPGVQFSVGMFKASQIDHQVACVFFTDRHGRHSMAVIDAWSDVYDEQVRFVHPSDMRDLGDRVVVRIGPTGNRLPGQPEARSDFTQELQFTRSVNRRWVIGPGKW